MVIHEEIWKNDKRVTKEMWPAHWEDVLTHVLVYYGIRTKKQLGIYPTLFSV